MIEKSDFYIEDNRMILFLGKMWAGMASEIEGFSIQQMI